MIIAEHPYNGRNDRVHHYSDAGKTIIQVETGIEYEEAVDAYPCIYSYIEGRDPSDIDVNSDDVMEAIKKLL